MTTPSELYEWFDRQAKSRGQEVALHTACSAIVHHVGMLAGLGISPSEIRAFVTRTLEDTERMMARVSEDKTLGENVDALMEGEKKPFLHVVPPGDGGKPS